MTVKSPVTLNTHTTLVIEFDVDTIIQQYKNQGKLDVSRFFKGLNKIQLYRCNETGYRFYYPDGIWGDSKFYEELRDIHSWYYPVDRWEHAIALPMINKEDKVLEVGCGEGAFIRMLHKAGVKDVTGLELNERAVNKLSEEGLVVKAETIQTFAEKNKEQFDTVCFFQVLEHIYEIKSFLDASIMALKKGGSMIIAVPNNTPYLFNHKMDETFNMPPHHAGLWNKETFEKLEHYYPVKVKTVLIKPLDDYKKWIRVKRKYHKENKSLKGLLFLAIPTFLTTLYLSLFKQQGSEILVEFVKK